MHKLVHAKASYSKPREAAFFVKNAWGVPVYLDAEFAHDETISLALDELVAVLTEEHPKGQNRRKLRRAEGTVCKRIRDSIVEQTGIKKGDWEAVINLGVESGRLIEQEDANATGKTKPVKILARVGMQAAEDDGPEQQNLC